MIRKEGYLAGYRKTLIFVCFLFFSASLAQAAVILPEVQSTTHPDPTKWYSNGSPEFSWNLNPEIVGVSYLITDKATSNPGPKSDGIIASISFAGIADGVQYFHIKFKENGAWGPIAHFQFNIDTVSPESFEVKKVNSEDSQPQILFETFDALSGIDYYEIQINGGSSTRINIDQAGKPYVLNFNQQQEGTQTVLVKAADKAGNLTVSSVLFTLPHADRAAFALGWAERFFNGLVNGISAYGVPMAFLAAFVGLLLWLFSALGRVFDKAWHKMLGKKEIRKNERLVDTTFEHLIKDMKDEIKFLNAIGKRRRLGPEEKYLKGKLEQYARALKKGA